MSVRYNSPTVADRLQAVVDNIDAGGNGALKLLDSAGSTLSTVSMARPCGTVSGNVLTFSGTLLDPAASASGEAVAARIEDGNGVSVITGLTVGTGSTSEIILSSSNIPANAIVAGQTVAITQATITGV